MSRGFYEKYSDIGIFVELHKITVFIWYICINNNYAALGELLLGAAFSCHISWHIFIVSCHISAILAIFYNVR